MSRAPRNGALARFGLKFGCWHQFVHFDGRTACSVLGMEQVHAACDKLFEEVDWLERLLDADEVDNDRLALVLSVAKRVRERSTILVKALARERDER